MWLRTSYVGQPFEVMRASLRLSSDSGLVFLPVYLWLSVLLEYFLFDIVSLSRLALNSSSFCFSLSSDGITGELSALDFFTTKPRSLLFSTP